MIVHLKRKAPKTHWYLKQARRISCKPVVILKYCVTPFGFSSATDFQKQKKKKQHSFLHAQQTVPNTRLAYSQTGKNNTNTMF